MKMALWQRLAVLTLLGWGISSFSNPGHTAQFEQQEIEQDNFIVLAAPGGDIGYKLLIIEQLNSSRPCWSETGSNPSNVEPLLLSFDFTGVCNRLVDSNGFSVRTAGQDQGLQYSLRVLRKGDELVLVAASNTERDTQIEIGRTYGLPNGFSRIVLDPGWRLTRRAFDGRAVGHVYLTYDQPMEVLVAASRRNSTFASRSPSMPAPVSSYPPPVATPNDAPNDAPDSTLDNAPDGSVIPVPSLPPAGASPVEPAPTPTPRPAPLPPLSTRPAPLPAPIPAPRPAPTPQTGAAPSLSTILPPPPPPVSSPEPAASETPDLDAQPEVIPPEETTGDTAQPQPTSEPNQSSRPAVTPIRPPIGVPRTSNSGGAPLRPRPLRREDPPVSSRPPASTTTPDRQSTAPNQNLDTADPADPVDTTVAQAETYQVVVVADSAEVQDKVRSLAPNAFLTTINGQVVMQVGVFRERAEADRLQQKLSLEGLPTAVIPVR